MFRVVIFFYLAASALGAQTTLILKNGRIWTGAPRQPWAEAVAVSGGAITHVGTTAVIAPLATAKTRVVDLGGRFAMPGFNDAHIHFLSGALGLREVDLTGACTLEEMQRRIRDYAGKNPDVEWITGRGWEYACFGATNRVARMRSGNPGGAVAATL